ncbi:hypothetical protein LEMLEM_LOCUS4043, partial [Lemmus lemmus]
MKEFKAGHTLQASTLHNTGQIPDEMSLLSIPHQHLPTLPHSVSCSFKRKGCMSHTSLVMPLEL